MTFACKHECAHKPRHPSLGDRSDSLRAFRRNLNYWDSVSTLAGEVANPHKTFPLALMLAVVLVILMYLLPLLACLGVMTEVSDWKLGFFATVSRQVGGQWLAWWMLAAAAVSHSLSRAHDVGCSTGPHSQP